MWSELSGHSHFRDSETGLSLFGGTPGIRALLPPTPSSLSAVGCCCAAQQTYVLTAGRVQMGTDIADKVEMYVLIFCRNITLEHLNLL